MRQLHIEGGARISGSLTISGNKNAALPMIAAAYLTSDDVVLHRVPDILDVHTMLDIARSLGAECEFSAGTLRIRCEHLTGSVVHESLCSQNRTSVLFAGPLLARTGRARLYPPGGDVIGRRRLDGHFYGLMRLGAMADFTDGYVFTVPGGMHGADLLLDEAGVTSTEQILLTAVLAEGTTVLYHAACEPHVTALADLLNAMGADISGQGTNRIVIHGVPSLHGTSFTLPEDYIEAGSYLALAAACGGELTLRGMTPSFYRMTRRVFSRMGMETIWADDSLTLPGGQVPVVREEFDGGVQTIADGPWPAFPSDMMSCLIVLATQARGTTLFFEKMFESRLYFVDRLISMGAHAVVCDPHRVLVTGPARLHGVTVTSPDIRAGMAMVIAALCADGKSTIHSADVIYRGYEQLTEKLCALGARVTETVV